jgi:hypothetical protein
VSSNQQYLSPSWGSSHKFSLRFDLPQTLVHCWTVGAAPGADPAGQQHTHSRRPTQDFKYGGVYPPALLGWVCPLLGGICRGLLGLAGLLFCVVLHVPLSPSPEVGTMSSRLHLSLCPVLSLVACLPFLRLFCTSSTPLLQACVLGSAVSFSFSPPVPECGTYFLQMAQLCGSVSPPVCAFWSDDSIHS